MVPSTRDQRLHVGELKRLIWNKSITLRTVPLIDGEDPDRLMHKLKMCPYDKTTTAEIVMLYVENVNSAQEFGKSKALNASLGPFSPVRGTEHAPRRQPTPNGRWIGH